MNKAPTDHNLETMAAHDAAFTVRTRFKDGVSREETRPFEAMPDGNWRAWRLNTAGLRLGEIPVERDPATGRLVFTARTDYDPDAATQFYELEKH